jgi:hypothetical protein
MPVPLSLLEIESALKESLRGMEGLPGIPDGHYVSLPLGVVRSILGYIESQRGGVAGGPPWSLKELSDGAFKGLDVDKMGIPDSDAPEDLKEFAQAMMLIYRTAYNAAYREVLAWLEENDDRLEYITDFVENKMSSIQTMDNAEFMSLLEGLDGIIGDKSE